MIYIFKKQLWNFQTLLLPYRLLDTSTGLKNVDTQRWKLAYYEAY